MSDDFLLFWFFIHDCKYKTEHFPLNTEQENKKRKKHGSGNTIQISVLTEHSSITSYLASVLNVVSAMIYQRLNWSVHAANCLPPPPSLRDYVQGVSSSSVSWFVASPSTSLL